VGLAVLELCAGGGAAVTELLADLEKQFPCLGNSTPLRRGFLLTKAKEKR